MIEKLAIVMPVYNEEKAIGTVLEKWLVALDALGVEYTINPYNDGSKDDSYKIIKAKAAQYPGKIIAHTNSNRGHGPTILRGYCEAAEAGYDWVFQVDSDDEMGPEKFSELWEKRNEYDFLMGQRSGRKQPFSRKIVSAMSRITVRTFYGNGIWDVNTPYRLMRTCVFQDIWKNIPKDTFAPNVIISGMALKQHLRCYEMKVPQTNRKTGEISIRKWKLFMASVKSFSQTIEFAFSQPGMIWWLFISALISYALKIAISTKGYNYDFESYQIVRDIVAQGGNVYAETTRYNYAPGWFLILGTGSFFHEYFRLFLITLLSLADFGIGLLFWKIHYHIAALFFILSPVGIYISGYHNQFDNLAIFFAFAGVYLLMELRKNHERKMTLAAACLFGISLVIKHVFIIFPIWILMRKIAWKKKLILVFIPLAIFCISFVPWLLPSVLAKNVIIQKETSAVCRNIRQDLVREKSLKIVNLTNLFSILEKNHNGDALYGFFRNVVFYKSTDNQIFKKYFLPPCNIIDNIPPVILFIFCMLGTGWLMRKQTWFISFLFYTASLVAFSPALADQYIAIPLVFVSYFYFPIGWLYHFGMGSILIFNISREYTYQTCIWLLLFVVFFCLIHLQKKLSHSK